MFEEVIEKLDIKEVRNCKCKHEWFEIHIQKGAILKKLEGVSMAWCFEKNMYISKSIKRIKIGHEH